MYQISHIHFLEKSNSANSKPVNLGNYQKVAHESPLMFVCQLRNKVTQAYVAMCLSKSDKCICLNCQSIAEIVKCICLKRKVGRALWCQLVTQDSPLATT